jgi:hypothetical protein
MIGNKLIDAMRTRFFTGILSIMCMLLLVISFLLSNERTNPTKMIGFILLIICGLLFLLGVVSIIRDEGIGTPSKSKVQIEIDQRGFFFISGLLILGLAIMHKYVNGAAFTEPVDFHIFNLWITCGVLAIITGIQAIIQKQI